MNKYVETVSLIKACEDAKQTAIANVQSAALQKHTRRKIFKRVVIAIFAALAVGASIFLSIVFRPAGSSAHEDRSNSSAPPEYVALDSIDKM